MRRLAYRFFSWCLRKLYQRKRFMAGNVLTAHDLNEQIDQIYEHLHTDMKVWHRCSVCTDFQRKIR